MKNLAVQAARAARDDLIESLYRDGLTLSEIGIQLGTESGQALTRERVRQILAQRGVTRQDGGQSERARKSREQRREGQRKRHQQKLEVLNAWCLQNLGCDRAEAERINGGIPISRKGRYAGKSESASDRYLDVRQQRLTKGESQYLSFVDWYRVWRDSGHWIDGYGPEQGFGLIRIHPDRPWSVNNAEAVRIGSWMSPALRLTRSRRADAGRSMVSQGISQQATAQALGVTQQTVSRWIQIAEPRPLTHIKKVF